MYMFQSFLKSIPKNRSQFVNELEIPDMTLTPFVWTEPDEHISVKSDSVVAGSVEDERGTLSTDADIPLSRAMTDSEIDYEQYTRIRDSCYSDPRDELKAAMAAFPHDYLTSLHSFQEASPAQEEPPAPARDRLRYLNDDLKRKMEKFYDEDCGAFTPDDPALYELEDAVRDLKIKAYGTDLDGTSS